MALTKHPEGSVKELWTLAFPLMLSSLSVMFMVFCDRWFLAHYSVAAHNAAVAATTMGWAFIFGWIVLANIVEVFVAQYNGAGLQKKLGEPVWQMIWLSLGSSLFFIPLSLWGGNFLFGSGPASYLEREYFSQMMVFGPFYPLGATLCGFYVGQGKIRLITAVVIAGSLINVVLDQVLIFGVGDWIPSLGVTGAAIATSAATVLQTIIFGWVFFNKKHREDHGTLNCKLHMNKLWECVRVGFPNAVFVCCETMAFAVYYNMMKSMGDSYITIAGICQTVLILFFFFAEGVNKATATIVGNMIGSGRSFLVNKVIYAGLKLNVAFFGLILGCFSLGAPLIINQLLPHASQEFIDEIRNSLETCLILMAFYMFFEGLRFQFAGVLTAAGDTVFLFIMGSLLAWLTMIVPVYIFVVYGQASIETACFICISYGAIASSFYLWRILSGKWRSIVISSDLARDCYL